MRLTIEYLAKKNQHEEENQTQNILDASRNSVEFINSFMSSSLGYIQQSFWRLF